MKKILLFVFILYYSKSTFAQQHELSLSLLTLQGYNNSLINNTYVKFNSGDEIKSSAINKTSGIDYLQPIFQYSKFNTHRNIEFSIAYGFFKSHVDRNESTLSTNDINKNPYLTLKELGTFNTSSHFIKLQIARRYYLGNYMFVLGLNMPIEYNFKTKGNTKYLFYDSLGSLTQIETNYFTLEKVIKTGVFINQSIYYQFFKNIWLGLDLNVGFNVNYHFGDAITTSTSYHINPSIVDYQTTHYNSLFDLAFGFRPYLFIKYQLPLANKQENNLHFQKAISN